MQPVREPQPETGRRCAVGLNTTYQITDKRPGKGTRSGALLPGFSAFSVNFRPEIVTKLCQWDINPPFITAKIDLHTKKSGIFRHFPYKFMTKFGGNNILYTGCTYVTIQMIFQLYEQKGGNGVHKGNFQSRVWADGGCSVQFLHHLSPSPDA